MGRGSLGGLIILQFIVTQRSKRKCLFLKRFLSASDFGVLVNCTKNDNSRIDKRFQPGSLPLFNHLRDGLLLTSPFFFWVLKDLFKGKTI